MERSWSRRKKLERVKKALDKKEKRHRQDTTWYELRVSAMEESERVMKEEMERGTVAKQEMAEWLEQEKKRLAREKLRSDTQKWYALVLVCLSWALVLFCFGISSL
ncbi:hypothetical protein Y032_0631g861 [Ancylostoma ceylanicum]|nr:hypothetical protein Y032_0631g861 [Ancylostoma ceylanicum]